MHAAKPETVALCSATGAVADRASAADQSDQQLPQRVGITPLDELDQVATLRLRQFFELLDQWEREISRTQACTGNDDRREI
jgi:hypothetical protein